MKTWGAALLRWVGRVVAVLLLVGFLVGVVSLYTRGLLGPIVTSIATVIIIVLLILYVYDIWTSPRG
jgi:membrane-bound ClpP family serine protease